MTRGSKRVAHLKVGIYRQVRAAWDIRLQRATSRTKFSAFRAEDFYFEVADTCLVAPEFQLRFDGVDLHLERDGLVSFTPLALLVGSSLLDRLKLEHGSLPPRPINLQDVLAAVRRFPHKIQRFLGKLITTQCYVVAIAERPPLGVDDASAES